MKQLRLPWSYMLLLGALMAFYACENEDKEVAKEVLPDARGAVVSSQKIESYTAEEIQQEISRVIPSLLAALIQPTFGVDVYKISYTTFDLDGNITKVSGAVLVPQGVSGDLPWMSYQHGTVTNKGGVPSRGLSNSFEVLIGLMLAGDGAVVSMADYLGLGDHEGFHPFLHADSEAWTSLDMLRATKEFSQGIGIPLNEELFLVGYSQGGHSTMALQRLMEQGGAPEFNLTASAPMAGPYSMAEVTLDLLALDDTFANPAVLPYTLLAYDEVYDIYDDPADVFRGDYVELINNLFTGAFDLEQINLRLPKIPFQMLEPAYLEAIRTDTQHPFRVALTENDLLNFTPQLPTRLYHCQGDEVVDYENSKTALAYFQEKGAPSVELITPDNIPGFELDHISCAFLSIILVRDWFKEFWE